MNILLVGSGGREHALARKIAASPLVDAFYIAPGNAGTALLGENVAIEAGDIEGLAAFAASADMDLAVVGPEAPLCLGLVDALWAVPVRKGMHGRGIPCFGPTKAAAEIEYSKPFAKELMTRLGIPTASYRVFADYETAASHAATLEKPMVIKAAGLAAGKGVFLPDSKREAVSILRDIMEAKRMGAAGGEVVIEERLEGEEISLMAFCDGSRVALLPPSQDHKRLLDGDLGPNTGGMGAYAPAPACPPDLAAKLQESIIQPVVDELARMGRPFIGVIYAGLMLTKDGPKVLEFNARLGDPEAEAVLALLESDLVPTLVACARGRLEDALPRWMSGSAASIVMASPGYPEASTGGQELDGLGEEPADGPSSADGEAYVLHSGTRIENGKIVARPGRVLAVTARAPGLEAALGKAYARLERITFPGARYRRDIGAKGLARLCARGGSAYAASGVDIDAGNKAVRLMTAAVKSTYTPAVLAGIGSFGGLYDASALKAMDEPVLVASTDGVGTKVKLAAAAGSYASIGADMVNHCIDDILVQGARPLFFLDYFASSRLEPATVAEVVSGMAGACRASGCVLIGGETAEMPGVYQEGEFDVAGTIVGVVERKAILPRVVNVDGAADGIRDGMVAGDLLVGLASDSPHTNGYSLLRKVFEGVELSKVYPELGAPLGDVLLKSHRSYLPLLAPILDSRPGLIKGLAHLTGGGFIENIPRILPAGLEARIHPGYWPEPPLYGLVRRLGGVEAEEMYRVFNMGIGMVAVVARERGPELLDLLASPMGGGPAEKAWIIGELAAGESGPDAATPPPVTRLL
jgi:phosphoribosylamine--glycine ligase/phosphoribosylaminoimidazole synthetase